MTKFGLAAAFAGVVTVGVLGANALSDWEYSDGQRTGNITKLSNKGLPFCKTWEGELAMDNLKTAKGGVSGTFSFSVKDPSIVEKLKEAQNSGQTVNLSYSQTLFQWPCEQKTDYEITAVSLVNAIK